MISIKNLPKSWKERERERDKNTKHKTEVKFNLRLFGLICCLLNKKEKDSGLYNETEQDTVNIYIYIFVKVWLK